MDNTECLNCGRLIYLGPRTQHGKEDTTATTIVWRHVDTESHFCKSTQAQPAYSAPFAAPQES